MVVCVCGCVCVVVCVCVCVCVCVVVCVVVCVCDCGCVQWTICLPFSQSKEVCPCWYGRRGDRVGMSVSLYQLTYSLAHMACGDCFKLVCVCVCGCFCVCVCVDVDMCVQTPWTSGTKRS